MQHECAVKCIINSEQERTCQKSSSTERSPRIILPEQTSAARMRCQVHHQQRTTENMPVEQQHGTESKHHLARTDRCSTCALSSASSTVNKREHARRAAARNGVQASSFQNKSAARMRSQVHHWQRTTENMPEKQQHGTESKHHLSRTKKVQHECVVKCIISREQQRTCQRSSSTERSPSIILPERTSAA